MQWFYDPGYDYGAGLPGLPREVHGFVLHKPSEIRAHLIGAGVVASDAFARPEAVSEGELRRVHDPRLIAALDEPASLAAAIELPELAHLPAAPLRRALVEPQLLAAGGTYLAMRTAAHGTWAVNLSGGYHHARRNLSHGFCLINDIALACARLRREGVRRRMLILDLDLHQGDGNATIFADDPEVFTVSVHEENLFPIPKMRSDIDIGLRSYAEDGDYLAAVEEAIARARRHFTPDMVVFVAGSDPYEDDPLGTLQVSAPAMRERDRRVAELARELGCPLVALPAGGYSDKSPAITAAGFGAIAEVESTTAPRR